jgi:hypothetical protein
LLQVRKAEHIDVRHLEPPVGDRTVDFAEHERFGREIQLEEAILRVSGMVRPPDGVEPVALPSAGKLGQRSERIRGLSRSFSASHVLDLRYAHEREVGVELDDRCHGDFSSQGLVPAVPSRCIA